MHNLPKNIRPLGPHNENQPSPDIANKFAFRTSAETAAEHSNQPPRQFTQSPNLLGRRMFEEPYSSMNLSQINSELDKNLDDIVAMLSRRKNLMTAKKRLILEQAEERINRAKMNIDSNQLVLTSDQQLSKIVSFAANQHTATKMLAKILQTIPEIKGPRIDEEQRSEQFWARNRKLQTDIDSILQKLKFIDKQLQRQNTEVLDICRELDRIEDTLKSFVGAKSSDHMQKVEPLFNAKKKNYDVLNKKIKERESSKDKKIQYIKRIKNILQELKRTREERLEEIAEFFGIENCWEFDNMETEANCDFATGVEELLKIKERNNQLNISEKQVLMEFEVLERDQERISNELLKKLSDQAKAFHNFNSIQNQKIKYTKFLSFIENETDNLSFSEIDPKEYLKKFKQVKNFFKRFLDEDILLKQGLTKTSETTKTFVSLLRATQNEKERRHQLLGLLQTCIRKRGQYEQRREEFRKIQFEESRNDQEMTQYEEDLQAILTDGDLDGYKKLGQAIGECQNERTRLTQMKEALERQMESMDNQVLSIANRIQEQYEDIMSDVLPSDFEYCFKSGEDVKKLRNQLRKMYKRLGLLNNE